jgi:hypothetical protein
MFYTVDVLGQKIDVIVADVFLNIFFGVPHLATFIFVIFVFVIASIAYIHPVYCVTVQSHDLLIMSPLP